MADYLVKLAEYDAARAAYQLRAAPYWAEVKAKRAARFAKRRAHREITLDDYVLTQPPDYTGPKKPIDPRPTAREVPVVADFLPARRAAIRLRAGAAGERGRLQARLCAECVGRRAEKDQAVRVYGSRLPATANMTSRPVSGVRSSPVLRRSPPRSATTSCLSTNSVELLAEQGRQFIETLKSRAAEASGAKKAALEKKTAVLQKMVTFARSVRDDWNVHERLGRTPKGLGIHALNLDIDVGPLLQTQKLMNVGQFRQDTRLFRAADRGRARNDEPDRRRQRF